MVDVWLAALPADAWMAGLAVVVLKSTVLLGLAALGVQALRRASSAARHLVLSAVVLGLLVLPMLGPLLPRWTVPVAGIEPVALSALVGGAPAAEQALPEVVRAATPGIAPGGTALRGGGAAAGAAEWSATGASAREAAPVPSGGDWSAAWLLLVWAAGAALVLGRLGVGLLALRRLTAQAEPVEDPEWLSLVQDASRALGLRRPVMLLRDARISVPMTWGVLWPVVVLPADEEEWSVERRRVVILHELAHVVRHDCVLQIAAQLACALYWFHPGAWWVARRLREEREGACDDRVLTAGARASAYAGHLLEVARGYRSTRLVGAAALSMSRPTLVYQLNPFSVFYIGSTHGSRQFDQLGLMDTDRQYFAKFQYLFRR